MEIGFICRPAKGQTACGDRQATFPNERSLLAMVADGLGHGPEAEEASTQAVDYVARALETDPHVSLTDLMNGCHRALAGTRGAAVGLARLDPSEGTLSFCGVGNIILACHPERRGVGISMPGVVGYRMRKVRVFESPLTEGDLVALYSDGISSRISLRTLAALSPQAAAEAAESEHGKDHDDATFLAIRVT